MLLFCLCVLAGAYATGFLRELPSDAGMAIVAMLAAGGLSVRRARPLGFFLLGLVMACVASRAMLADRLSPELQGQTLTAIVRIASFPEESPVSLRFAVDTVDEPCLPARLRLSWYDATDMPRLGETWRLDLRLKRPRGLANDTGFDYELWLARERIGATGYVVASKTNARLEVPVERLAALRQRLVDRIIGVTGGNDATAVLLAITVGARHLIGKERWEQFAVTGTSHLMAISGLHVGLAAGGAWFLARLLLPFFFRSANIRDVAVFVAAVAACVYAGVSGFAVPAMRATLMTLLAAIAFMLRRQLGADRVIAVACLAVFASDPLAIHAPGFKLSFGAVAILLWTARQRQAGSATEFSTAWSRLTTAVTRLSALQLTLLFGLFPMTVLVFGRVSWLAPVINLLVLPLFGFLTVPAALAGLLFDGPLAGLGDMLLLLAWQSVRLTLWFINAVAAWPPARTYVAIPTGAMLFVVALAALWAVLPTGFPGRTLAWVAAISTLLWKPPPPPPGCVDLVALEVGQGLSLVIRTARRTLIYDAGPSYRGGSDLGQLVLVPWLRASGTERVDLLVISHAHDDHSGGAASLLDAFDSKMVMSGEYVASIDWPQVACRSGQAWLWDGVRFGILHPGNYPLQSRNNASCVLEIAAGAYRILLTGDIESPVENHLVRTGVLSRADIVVVPHHGSRTSSGAAFVDALRPGVAIVSAGFDNRWGFPKQEVVLRWQDAGAHVMNTATSGSIHFRACADSGVELLGEQRRRMQRYWHERASEQ